MDEVSDEVSSLHLDNMIMICSDNLFRACRCDREAFCADISEKPP
jgi:hypothetical protein